MLISIWIPIILTVIAIFWWVNPIDLPGPFDEIVVTLIALGAWLAFTVEKSIITFINDIATGNISSIIIIIIVIAVIIAYVKTKKD